jgi:hypothetical protein
VYVVIVYCYSSSHVCYIHISLTLTVVLLIAHPNMFYMQECRLIMMRINQARYKIEIGEVEAWCNVLR